jgi:hypothetical protein
LLESADKARRLALDLDLPPSATTARKRFMSYLSALRLHC